MQFTLHREAANQPDVVALIEALDAYQKPLYPAESHHGIDLSALSMPNVIFVVARNEQRIAVGCGAIVLEIGYGELKRMYTTPSVRGQGIGRAILSALEQLAAHAGISVFRLETGYLQPEAIALYERCGYRHRGPFGDYTNDPNSVFMEKPGLQNGYRLRLAQLADAEEIGSLIARSAREVGSQDYSSASIEGALTGAFGVDTQLLRDQTYFVIEHQGALVAAGGWSRRRTLFGSDARSGREPDLLDPAIDSARIRAFFVHPAHVRLGLGSALLCASEVAARAEGFRSFQMMATRTGRPLYQRFGYSGDEPINHPVGDHTTIEFYPMSKQDPILQ
jgi:putative acetyltransferase